ncbi:hypothetical protein J7643_05735 [bacterium]|nr:hypothetical protein [bacterium]
MMSGKLGWGLVGALCLLSAGTADALPLEGRVSALLRPPQVSAGGQSAFFAMGGMAELAFRDAPWFAGGLLVADSYKGSTGLDFSGEQQRTLWGGYRWLLSEQTTTGVLLGINQYRPMPLGGPRDDEAAAAVFNEQAWRPMLGISYAHRWGWGGWIRLMPHYVFNVDPSPYPAYLEPGSSLLMMSGLPWLELGLRVLPNLEVSAALSKTPLRAAIVF